MRNHAKPLTAGSNQRQAKGLGRVFRGSFTGRGASAGAKGSGTPSRRRPLAVLALASALLATALVVATAFAGKDVVLTIGDGDSGDDPGTFANPVGLDVNDPEVAEGSEDPYGNPTDGYIYVADEDNHRVEVFDSEHDFVFTLGGGVNAAEPAAFVCPRPGSPADDCAQSGDQENQEGGYFDDLKDVAIDQSDGSLYVMDEDNARVQKFTADGEFLWTVGNNVNTDGLPTPDLCLAGDTCKAGTNDVAENGFTVNSTGHLAVDPNTPFDLYVADEDHSRIQVFNSEGEFQRMYGYGVSDGEAEPQVCEAACQNGKTDGTENILGQLDEPIDVDVDDAGRVYVLDDDNENVVRFENGTTFANPEVFAEAALSASPKPGRIDISPGPEAASTDDAIYVTKEQEGETRLLELDESGAVQDTHMENAGVSISAFAGGIAVNRPLGELFVSDDFPDYVYVLDDPLPALEVILDPITVKDDVSATLTGTVDPLGGLVTECAFEYSIDPGFTGAVEVPEEACEGLEPNGGPQVIEEDIEGLIPNTTYHVRLRAERPFLGESEVLDTQSFLTDPAPPVVDNLAATSVTDTSARLGGTIDPRNSETTYIFEHGPTEALGNETAPLAIGDAVEEITVSQLVTGLAKDSDYFFRISATNEFGTTTSATESFHTRALPLPNPANRAYEQVSPVDKNWGDAITSSSASPNVMSSIYVGYDGESIAYGSANGFAEDPVGQVLLFQALYASWRGPGGWGTQTLAPPACASDLDDVDFFLEWLSFGSYVSGNVEAAVIPQREAASCTVPPLDPGAILPATNLYRVDLLADPDTYDLLIPEPDPATPLDDIEAHGNFEAASDDYSHIVYRSRGQQTPGSPAGNFKLFEWAEGTLRLVSIDPSGEPFETSSFVPNGASENSPLTLGGNGGFPDMRNAVSSDGERILFTGTSGFELYMREGGTITRHVSESECTSECGAGAGEQFRWADVDGDTVFFSSTQKLTDDDETDASSGSEDLYLYRHSADPASEANLTLISEDDEPADGTTGDVLGVAGVSDDGEAVYFVADNQLVVGGPTAAGLKTYRWEWNGGSPTLEYLTAASNDLQPAPAIENAHMERRVSEDGSAYMVETSKRIVPAADGDADIDVYLWRGGEGWSCVSCQVPGEPSGGNSTTGRVGWLGDQFSTKEIEIDRELESAISADGERVFFQTPDSLVAGDTNGPCERKGTVESGFYYPCGDIYEWHDGRLALITPGTASTDADLLGISDSGRDVMFYTRESLVGWDIDKYIDIYDARIGGGFPEPPPQPPACEGEGCRDEGSEEPAIAGAGTAAFQGPGNRTTGAKGRCPAGKLRRGKRCLPLRAIARKRCRRLSGPAKRRCVRKQTARLRRAQRAARARAANTDRRASR